MKNSKNKHTSLTAFAKDMLISEDLLTVAQTEQIVGKGQTEVNTSESEPAAAEIHDDWAWD